MTPVGSSRALPGIVICAWDAADQRWDPVEDLSGEPWHPPGARTIAVAAEAPEPLAERLSRHLEDGGVRALLLVGGGHGDGFELQLRAENRDPGGTKRGDRLGPALARATAPAAAVIQGLADAGVTARSTSEVDPDVGSYLLYRVLAGLPDDGETPAVALLRAPPETPSPEVCKAVKTAAQVLTQHLSPHLRRSA